MKYHGVFFDFDYTLGDSTGPIARGYRAGFAALGLPEPALEQVRTTVGMTLEDGYTHLTGDMDEGRKKEFAHRFHITVGKLAQKAGQRVMIEETVLLPGAVELLSALKSAGVRAAIVSTKPGNTIREIFDFQGHLDLLDLVVGGDEVSRSKPDPEGVAIALDKLGLAREQILFCGDTVIDAATAQGAGCDFCAVLNGTTPREAFSDYPHVHIADDLAGLQRWLGL